MGRPPFHRAFGGHERLCDHLPAEHALPSRGALADEMVWRGGLEIKQADKIGGGQGHSVSLEVALSGRG